jgi:hypothetical protein
VFITGSCCEEKNHLTNRAHQNYENKLRSGLDGFKTNLKIYLHTGGHDHCSRVMDPLVDTKEVKSEEMWGANPTKPTAEVFGKVAAGIHVVELRLKLKRQASVSSSSSMATPARKIHRAEESDQNNQGRIVTVSTGRIADGQMQYKDIRVVAAQEESRGRDRGRSTRCWSDRGFRSVYRGRGRRVAGHGGAAATTPAIAVSIAAASIEVDYTKLR